MVENVSNSSERCLAWLKAFSKFLENKSVAKLEELFHDRCFWRDLLSFTWNIKTSEGLKQVKSTFASTKSSIVFKSLKILDVSNEESEKISSWFSFETNYGKCRGQLILVKGRCEVLFTTLEDLKGFEEKQKETRPAGLVHKAHKDRKTWKEIRTRELTEIGTTQQPHVLVIGGGQGGLALAARLKQLNIPTLLVEKNAKIGDSWRNRYRTLVLHDPVWYDHMPYLQFPENWPTFTPKDKLGDWLEAYSSIFELDVWTKTECIKANFNEESKNWHVNLLKEGENIEIKAKEIVFATGAYGPAKEINWAKKETYKGILIHSSEYKEAKIFQGKNCLVVGAASSAHDIAVDLWEAGANVTMLQRSPTTVVKSETLMEMGFPIYSQQAVNDGIDVDKADLISAATPFTLFKEQQIELYKEIRKVDSEFYNKLEKSGFKLDFGEDESGLMMKALRTASGYYIDVGASELISNGEIKIISGDEVMSMHPTGVLLSSGRKIEMEVIIACTGYQSMHETVAQIVSREVADKVGPCWGLGSGVKGDPGPWQGELRNMWKPTAIDSLWFHGGNLALSRFYSKILALQLKARQENLDISVIN